MLLDLSATFDMVDHQLLSDQLKTHLGVTGNASSYSRHTWRYVNRHYTS